MNEIKDCIDALLAAVQNSEEYQKFEKYRDLLKENPELMDRVNAFRGNNFRLQNEANRDELFRGTEQLNRESRELRRDPLVNAFLDAELALIHQTSFLSFFAGNLIQRLPFTIIHDKSMKSTKNFSILTQESAFYRYAQILPEK